MGKRLIIAEKPSVGRDIAWILGCKEKGQGCFVGQSEVVTWAFGHLVSQKMPGEYDSKYDTWTVEDLPIVPAPFELTVNYSGKNQFETIKAWMNSSEIDNIVCATDAGREGELIFRYIYQMAGCSKPVDRLWISSLTPSAIKKGFENLRPDSEYDNLYESARCRAEADWLVGINGSRAYSVENDTTISVGRVQSPTLSILVNRELERRSFIPEEYCEAVGSFDGYTGKMINPEKQCTDEYSHFPIQDKSKLNTFAAHHSKMAKIIHASNEYESQPPQLLYDLTSLQRDANRIFGMSSKWTLDIAQSLYEKRKAITYPRTDSRFLSSDLNSQLKKRLESITSPELKPFVKQALESDRDLFGRFISNERVTDHHAIIPTGEARGTEDWTNQEKKIYDLIVRRFIGMFLPDLKYIDQELITSVDGKEFLSKGVKVVAGGWSEVDKSRGVKLQQLPDMAEGAQTTISSIRVRTDKTKPPIPHTEASLLLAMEHAGKAASGDDVHGEKEFGIGTPATRADIIEKLIEKEFVVRKGKVLNPTERGIKLVEILPEFLRSPVMTGEWEAKLEEISKGEYCPDEFMQGIRSLTQDVVEYAIQLGDTGIKNANSVGACPLCGNPVIEYENAYYCRNKECGFRKIYKAVKGFHPTLNRLTMRELIAAGKAETDKGLYSLITEPPYIAFTYSPKPGPQYDKLVELIEDYGFEPVNMISSGGSLWIAGGHNDELLKDFVKDCKEIGCVFEYAKDSKALKHKSGWYLMISKDDADKLNAEISKMTSKTSDINLVCSKDTSEDAVLKLIEESGFEYSDKRAAGGSLWIIAGQEECEQLIKACKKLGTKFVFTERGSRSTGRRPGWYSIEKAK